MSESSSTPFAELPAGLVEEALNLVTSEADVLLTAFQKMKADMSVYRKALEDRRWIRHESDLGYPPWPTTCGVDGSYAIDRLLTADLAAAAAVAVEGLTPPSEKRYWERPHHSTFLAAEVHHSDTATVLRAVMLGRELLLAVRAPHDVVMFDGTLTLPVIYFNQALNKAPELENLRCAREFLDNCGDYLEAYRMILRPNRSDRQIVALPKYSTRREIGRKVGWPHQHDDRGLLTLILQPGELTDPLPLEQPPQPWHLGLNALPEETRELIAPVAGDAVEALGDVYVFYYKPHAWLPALRVEAPKETLTNSYRLAVIVQGLKHQCATPSMLEPYPLYLADRTVKSLSKALPAFRQVATQRVAEQYPGDIGDVFFAMHGYRTESGG